MSAVASPFGLRPAFKSGGTPASEALQSSILTAYAVTILQGAPVKIGTNGYLELAAAGDRAVGVFQGVEYTPSTGRRVVDNKWIASTTATEIVAYYTADPQLTYELQANATMTQDDIGKQMDWTTATAGSTTTGLSSVALGVSTSAANAGLRVVGLIPGPDNAWGDLFPIVLVQFSEHQFVADVAAF